jgi:hypothetical protein
MPSWSWLSTGYSWLLAALRGLTKGLLCATTMDTFENRRLQKSGCPLQGVVFEGLARAAVVAEAVLLRGALEASTPAMAVTSSVVDEGMEVGVAMPFPTPDTIVAGMAPRADAIAVLALLGIGDVEGINETCAKRHCASKAQGRRRDDIENIIRTV